MTDEHGNVVPNVDVAFSVSDGALINTVIGRTGNDGKATATVTIRKAGTYTVTAKVNNKATSKQTTFIADRTTAKITAANLLIDPDDSPADGKTANGVTATVTDAEGNRVPNMEVIFTVSDGAAITPQKVKTDSDGKATVKITSSKAANGKDAFTFIAVVKDVNGNLVPNVELTWQQDKGADVTLPKPARSKTDAKGEAKIDFTSTTKAVENIQVSTQLTDGKVNKADKTVSFVGDTAIAEIQIKTLKQNNILPADNQSEYPFEISVVTDTNGNVLKDYVLDVLIPALSIIKKLTTDNQGKVKFSPKSAGAGKFDATVISSTNKAVSDKFKVQYTITTLSSAD